MLHDNLSLKISIDEFPMHPRHDFDNLTQIYALHKRYAFSEIKLDNSNCNSWTDEYKLICKAFDIALILPLYLYDHSGLTIATEPFSCRWDSGQLGYIFITKDNLRKSFSCKRITHNILSKAKESLNAEIKIFDLYLRGEVYIVEVMDDSKNVLDSCGSIYGHQYAQKIGEELKQNLMKKCA